MDDGVTHLLLAAPNPPANTGWSSRTKTLTATLFAEDEFDPLDVNTVAVVLCSCSCNCFRLVLYLRFWNHIFTCVSVNFSACAKSARSGPERYRCWLNRRSNSYTWACENAALDLFFRCCCCCGWWWWWFGDRKLGLPSCEWWLKWRWCGPAVGGGDLANNKLGGEEESPEMIPLSDTPSSVGSKRQERKSVTSLAR